MNSKKLLLLNGSPRKKSTSFSFARTLKRLSEDAENSAEIIHVIDYFDGKQELNDLRERIMKSDVIAIIAPLYTDTLPYHNIWLLEKLADEYKDDMKGKSFFAVGQCGFPDITRIEPLIDSCRLFAEEAELKWLGGLAYGGGPMINGALLEELGKKGEKITLAFELALKNVFNGQIISYESQELMTVNIPKLLYWPIAAFLNHQTRKQARINGNLDFKRRIYLE